MITVGIPKALLYYKYGNLWSNFLENLGCNVIISPNTTLDILDNNINTCLPIKIYLGHINYLKDKCDYILIPSIKEKVCSNIDNINKTNINILNIDINIKNEEYSFIKIGKKLGFSYLKSLKAYNIAKRKDNLIKIRKYNKQRSIIASSNKIKILLASHPYNLYDNLLGKKIINILENLNIDIIYSDSYDLKYMNKELVEITKNNPFIYNKEIIASIVHYKDVVDGIILISSSMCENDSLANYMIKRSINTPLLDLILDINNDNYNLIYEFIKIINERKNNNE